MKGNEERKTSDKTGIELLLTVVPVLFYLLLEEDYLFNILLFLPMDHQVRDKSKKLFRLTL